ncbi:MAG: hypothetical protein HY040_25515 [Planctomycetes bacterium]|nr:hypothetical protein [Planctomycetota bacterium]
MLNSVAVPPKRRWRRWALRIVLAFVVIVVLAFGVRTLFTLWDDADLAEIIAQLDRDDPNWRLEDIEAQRREVPPEENSALQAMQVHAIKGGNGLRSWALQDVYRKLFEEKPPPSQAQLNIQQVKYMRDRMQALGKTITEARKLKDMPYGRFPISYAPDFYSTSNTDQQRARELWELLYWDAALCVQDNDADGALESGLAMLNACRAMGDEPTPIAWLIRMAGNYLLIEALERVLAQGQPSEVALKGMQEALARELAEASLVKALRGERAGYHHLMNSIASGQASLSSIPTRPGKKSEPSLLEMISSRRPKDHAQLLRILTEAVQAGELPLHEQEQAFESIDAKLAEEKARSADVLGKFAGFAHVYHRRQANLRCAMTAMAAERYRLPQVDWPRTLDDLVAAKLLDAVPRDPFIDAPLRLKHQPDGIVIYSVGVDRQDNGGYFDREKFEETGTDLGFRLWNVSARRQAPLPTVTIDASDYRK